MPFISSLAISLYNSIRGGGAAGEAATLLLDLYPNAAAAYSLRKLKTDYTGPAIRVRESGGAEADIGFDANGNLDTAALLAHCGGNDGFVKTWYDQSGNGVDAEQATLALQPTIVSAGVLEEYNSKPSLSIDSNFMTSNSAIPIGTSGFASMFISGGNFSTTATIAGFETGIRYWRTRINATLNTLSAQKIDGGIFVDQTPLEGGRLLISSTFLRPTELEIFGNGTSDGATASDSIADVNSTLGLFGRSTTLERSTGNVFEIIYYASDQSANRTAIETNINAYYNIYWDGSQTGLLDTYSGASAAYSVRALSSSYTGPLMRVRRSSDNAEIDVFAKYNGDLDTDAIESFSLGTDDVFVTTWYDQSGNGVNLIQATASSQPQIAAAGVVNLSNTKPELLANTTDLMRSSLSTTDTYYIFYVSRANGKSIMFGSNNSADFTLAASPGSASTPVEGNSTTNTFYVNGAIEAPTTQGGVYTLLNPQNISYIDVALNYVGTSLSIGYNNSTTYPMMSSQELIIYAVDQTSNRTAIETNINDYYGIYWDGSKTGILDDYPDASAAYSVRALNSAYTGPLVRVRRSSDNEERDIYAKYDGSLDTTTLESFCAATNGFVTTWYDQSGQGNDASQATAANQPQIVSSGSVLLVNGKPAVYGNNKEIETFPTTVNPFSVNNEYSTFALWQNDFNTYGNGLVVSWIDGGAALLYPIGHLALSTARNFVEATPSNVLAEASIANNTQVLTSSILTQTDVEISANGSTPSTTALSGNTPNTGNVNFTLFSRRVSVLPMDGYIQEVIHYASDESNNRTAIETNINAYYNIYWDGSKTGILDDYPNAAAAYSLRALNSAYTGALIRVRRSSDNEERDIYALYDGTLDEEALTDFVGANDGFVVTWYDQSGDGNNATQAAAANQPQIVASGSVFTQNSLPTISFSSDYLTNAGSLTYAGGVSYFATFNSSAIGSVNRIWSDDITGVQGSIIAYSDNTNTINDNGGGYKSISFTASNGNQLRTLVFNDSNGVYNILQNGSSLASGTLAGWSGPIAASGASNIGIMSSGDGAQTLTGTMQELIIYGNDQSSNRTAIETNINNHYSIYP